MLLLLQDEHVIEALTPHTEEEALTDGVGPRGLIRRLENLDVTRLGNSRESHAKLALVIPDEVLRPYAVSGGEPSLLCRPSVGRSACDPYMDHFARVQEGDEEGEQRAEEQVSHWQKVERTFGWLTRYRRLARDYESLPQSSEAFIQIASIRLFLTRLTPFHSLAT